MPPKYRVASRIIGNPCGIRGNQELDSIIATVILEADICIASKISLMWFVVVVVVIAVVVIVTVAKAAMVVTVATGQLSGFAIHDSDWYRCQGGCLCRS